MTVRLDTALVGGSREWYIPADKFRTLLVTIGATGGFRYEDNVMVTTPMKKHVRLLVNTLNRAAR